MITTTHSVTAPVVWHFGGSTSWLQVALVPVVVVVVVVSVVDGVGVVVEQLLHSTGHDSAKVGTVIHMWLLPAQPSGSGLLLHVGTVLVVTVLVVMVLVVTVLVVADGTVVVVAVAVVTVVAVTVDVIAQSSFS